MFGRDRLVHGRDPPAGSSWLDDATLPPLTKSGASSPARRQRKPGEDYRPAHFMECAL
jgi:hypothetical protein